MKKLKNEFITLGTDPELFLEKDNNIIGSEKVIPEDGLLLERSDNEKVVRDGIQIELHPDPSTCRALLADSIEKVLERLKKQLASNEGVKSNFSQIVRVSESEIKSLSEGSRKLGCMPSYNVYGDFKIDVDPTKYLFRSAGGHIHLGTDDLILREKIQNADALIPILDIIVGNTCVLIDRDEGNIERRKNYGRAGEFRLPKYGIEYRTPSNFWLRSYPLMSLVFGLARFGVSILAQSTDNNNYSKELLKLVNIQDIRKAIDTNDFDLALSNFNKIRGFIEDTVDLEVPEIAWFPLCKDNINNFLKFVDDVKTLGLDKVFPQDPLEHWTEIYEFHEEGWETYIYNYGN